MDNFLFALERPPRFPLETESLVIPKYIAEDRFSMTVIGTFADLDKLMDAAQELQGILAQCAAWYDSEPEAQAQLFDAKAEVPLELPIADWLTSRNIAVHSTGIGWLGKESEAKDAVMRIGSSLCVHRLKTSYKKLLNSKDLDDFDDFDDFDCDENYCGHHPLIDFFEEFGGEVLIVGDNGGESQVVADLTCSCGDLAGNHLKRELGQYRSLYYYLHARPPWHSKGISPDEVRARETFKRLSSAEAEHPDDHPEVARKLKQQYTDYRSWGIDIGFHVGQLQVVKHNRYWRVASEELPISTHTMEICFEDQTLSLGWITFDSFVYGFPSIVHYLAKHGCTDFRYELVDFDKVRGD